TGNKWMIFWTKPGNTPMGTYTPQRKPIIVPMIVLTVAKADWVLTNNTINKLSTLLNKTEIPIKPMICIFSAQEKNEPPDAAKNNWQQIKALNVNTNPINKELMQ